MDNMDKTIFSLSPHSATIKLNTVPSFPAFLRPVARSDLITRQANSIYCSPPGPRQVNSFDNPPPGPGSQLNRSSPPAPRQVNLIVLLLQAQGSQLNRSPPNSDEIRIWRL